MTLAIAPPVSAYWDWRGQAIHYVKAGRSRPDYPPLLLIHGFGASTDHWRKNIAGLQREFEVYAIDLLGFGRSAKPDWQYSGTLWRDQLADFVQTVIGQPAVVVGNSLGGYAALCLGADVAGAVAGVGLLNSAGPFSEDRPASEQRSNPWRQAIAKAIQTFMLQPVPSWLLFQYVRRPETIR
ncbi:MAG: alpha/beta fold hydrolase, partial [Cyanobacteria bacterium P01_H01_bin.119]